MEVFGIDTAARKYHYNYRSCKKEITFDYAWDKAFKAWRELVAEGWLRPEDNFKAPERGNIGTEAGFNDYLRVNEQIESYFEATGEPLKCMLAETWRAYEDCKVTCRNAKGRACSFWVVRFGRACPYYVARKEPSAGYGRRIDDFSGFYDIQIVQRAEKPIRAEIKYVVTESELDRLVAIRLAAISTPKA